jgi:dihydroxyacetone kinase
LDHGLEEFWLAPADTPAFRCGAVIPAEPAPPLAEEKPEDAPIPPATEASQASGQCLAALLARIAEAMGKAELELGRIDALAGDGDHGQAMSRGSAAAKEAADKAIADGAGAATVLARAGDAWADRAGGASGALWGVMLRTLSHALTDELPTSLEQVVAGARSARDAVVRLGGAKIADKTLLDSLDPFVTTLAQGSLNQRSLSDAWGLAAGAARQAADETALLTPKLGRARIHAARSIGHPDAGASSFALCVETISAFLADQKI